MEYPKTYLYDGGVGVGTAIFDDFNSWALGIKILVLCEQAAVEKDLVICSNVRISVTLFVAQT